VSNQIRFFVEGVPKPAGSKSAFPIKGTTRIAIVDASGKAGKLWRKLVALKAKEVMRNRELITGPVIAEFMFLMPRPKAHFNRAGILKDNIYKNPAPKYHTIKPNVLKLARSVEDAMSGIVYKDDSQIVKEQMGKDYVIDEMGVYIVIQEM